MGASPDGLVIDPSEQQPLGLVEIKCPARAEKLSLFDLSTNKEHKSTFCLRYIRDTYELKRRTITITRFKGSSTSHVEVGATSCYGHHQRQSTVSLLNEFIMMTLFGATQCTLDCIVFTWDRCYLS